MRAEFVISAVQFAPYWLQLEKNIERMRSYVEAEAKQGSKLVVFPELANIGYITPALLGEPVDIEGMDATEAISRYLRAAETVPGPTTEALSELTKRYGIYVVVGVAQRHPVIKFTLYNSSVLIGPSGVVGLYHKVHAAVNEKQVFYPGSILDVYETELGNIGMCICYDGRFPELPRILALKGAEIICNIWYVIGAHSAATPGDDRLKHRAYTRAQENGVYYVNCNAAASGRAGEVQSTGYSAIASPNGTLIAASETAQEDVIRAVITEEEFVRYRSVLSLFRDRRPELYGLICEPLSAPLDSSTTSPPRRSKTLQSVARQE